MSLLLRVISKNISKRAFHGVSPHSRTLFTGGSGSARSPLRTGVYTAAFLTSTGIFLAYYFDARSALHRYIFTPLVRHAFDPETGHKLAVQVLRSGLAPRDPVEDDPRLHFKIWEEPLSNPIGVAAGFDKDGEAVDGLYELGFSWVEIGSVTPKPQPGNPRPRVFRLSEDAGLINRYGFPSKGHVSVLSRLRARLPTFDTAAENASLRKNSLFAVNLGKNKDSAVDAIDDYVAGVRVFGPYSDVLVVNISSPNTPGLRGLQNRELLGRLLDGVTSARDQLAPSSVSSRKPKLVLKIAPDLNESQLVEMADVIRKSNIDGVIVSNTTVQRPSYLISESKHETGGLSGAPVKEFSLQALRTLRKHLPASVPLIGCGGISTGADALEYAKAGASMVQVYTSFGYDGVGACRRIKDELLEELAKEGHTWSEVVGKAVNELSWKEEPKGESRGGTVAQLIEEANELNGLLDKLGESIERDASGV